jgi:hypothetical protein
LPLERQKKEKGLKGQIMMGAHAGVIYNMRGIFSFRESGSTRSTSLLQLPILREEHEGFYVSNHEPFREITAEKMML